MVENLKGAFMSDIFDINEMTEEDIKLQYITPALTSKWDIKKITMETSPLNNFTDGKVHIKGNIPSRDKGKRCDYVLWYNRGTPLAIVEAKDHNHSSSFGMQQAIAYGMMMNVPFVYTSNGTSFFEHDFTTGLEKEFPLTEFPTLEELYARWKNVDAQKILEVENKMQYAIDGNTKIYDGVPAASCRRAFRGSATASFLRFATLHYGTATPPLQSLTQGS